MANVEELSEVAEPDQEAVRIGGILRDLRKSYGWQIWRLGHAVKRSRPNLCNIEAGRRRADAPLLRAIAQAYGIPITALIAVLYPPGHEAPPEMLVSLLYGTTSEPADAS